MTVGTRVVLAPTGTAFVPVQSVAAEAEHAAASAETGVRMLRIHQARLHPFAGLLPIGRQRNIIVRFQTAIDAEWLLKGEQSAGHRKPDRQPDLCQPRHAGLYADLICLRM